MVLLIQPIRLSRVHDDAMRIVTEHRVWIREKVGLAAFIQRRPVLAAVGGLEHAAARNADVQMPGVARIDQDRMHQLAVRRTLRSRRPLRAHRVIVESCNRRPTDAGVLRPKQTRRRRPGIPDARLTCMPGRQPEYAFNSARGLALFTLPKRRRLRRLLPLTTSISRSEYSRTEVSGLRRHQHDVRCARVLHDVMNDVAEKLRARQLPR